MHAIIETGGKQYRVAPGDVIRVPKLAGDVGSDHRIFRSSGGLSATPARCWPAPKLPDYKVTGTITANGRGEKILVFKFKRKKQYKRTIGHRQNYTEVQVNEIVA